MFPVGIGQSYRESFMTLAPVFADGDDGRYTSTDNINWKTFTGLAPGRYSSHSRRCCAGEEVHWSVGELPAAGTRNYRAAYIIGL